MTGRDRRSTRALAWGLAAVLIAVLVPLAVFGIQRGECRDAAVDSGAVSVCTTGPWVGEPAAVVVCAIALLAVVICAVRAIRALRALRALRGRRSS